MSRCEYGANHVDGPCIHCEAKALRARVAELEAALRKLRRHRGRCRDYGTLQGMSSCPTCDQIDTMICGQRWWIPSAEEVSP